MARNRALAAVMVAYAAFSATQNAAWIAMLVYAYDRGGAGTAGAVAVAQLVPAALLAPVAAAVADRRSPVGVLVGGYLVQVAGMLATALAIGLEAPLAAYAGAVIASAAVASTRPAQTTLVPGLVRNAEELTAANALTGWIESASVVASSAATALLLTLAGPGLVFAVAGAAGLVSVGLAATIRGTRPIAVDEAAGLAGTFAGFRVLARQSAPRLLVALLSAQWVVIGALDILFVVLAVDVLDRGQGWVGYLSMAYGAGGVLAGLAGMALVGRRRLVTPILGGVILIGVALGLSALAPTAAATVVLLTIVGGGRALFNLATRTLLQRAVPAEVVGRVFGVAEALAMAGLAVGSAIVPLLVAVGGTVAAVLGTAAILPLVALVGGRALFTLDAAAHVPIVEIALLRSLRIFHALPAPALEGLARSMEPVELAAGDVLIREGEPGDRFYAIADGRLEITIGGAPVATNVRGDGIGEIALLYSVPRTATASAASSATVFALSREDFLTAVTGHTPSARAAAAVADERLDQDRHRQSPKPDDPQPDSASP
ncbi:MAG TPA: cyclic nucleotide-binding domain-containing protein [Acidimicrobiales bacterium]|nr:cyclic nucleotide-binding domain-containing protein [Acidimicrobiales bacterium]